MKLIATSARRRSPASLHFALANLSYIAAIFILFAAGLAFAQEGAAPAVAPVTELASTESLFLKLLGLLVVPVAGLLTTLLAMLTAWIREKHAGNKFAMGTTVVLDLLGSYLSRAKAQLAPELREALADGVLDAAERAKLKQHLIDLVLKEAPADAVKVVTGVFGTAFPAWLEGKAEQAIDAMAAETAPASP